MVVAFSPTMVHHNGMKYKPYRLYVLIPNLILTLVCVLWLCVPRAGAQITSFSVWFVSTAPAGACMNGPPLQYDYLTGVLYGCYSSTWTAVTTGGSGTFTALSGDATSTATGGTTTVLKTNGNAFTPMSTLPVTNYSVTGSGAAGSPNWITPTGNGQCLMSGAASYATTEPSFQTCPSGGGNVSTTAGATFGAYLYDFSASTLKIPASAGFTASATSMFGYDSTGTTPVFWSGGASHALGTNAFSSTAFGNMNQAVANSAANTVSVSVGTSGTAFAKTPVTIDPSTGAIAGAASLTITPAGGLSGEMALPQGTANTPPANSVGYQAPTSVSTAYLITFPAAYAAGLVHRTNANPSVESVSAVVDGDLSGTVGVAHGGTALATLTAHALYAGNATSAPSAIGPDASTTKFLASAGSSADPAFRAIATGDLPTAQVTRQVTFTDIAPVTGDDALIVLMDPPTAVHLTRFSCGVTGTTSVIVNLVKATLSLLGADMTATAGDVNTVITTTFLNTGSQCGGTTSCAVAAHAPVTVHIGTISGTPTSVSCAADYTVD